MINPSLRIALFPLSSSTRTLIRVLPAESAVLEDDILFVDIVAEAETAERETPLALASRHVGKFLDVVSSRPVCGVLPQD
jgi:hypothetical protein